MSAPHQQTMKQELGQLIVGFVDGVSNLYAMRDSENQPIEDDGPVVLTQQLCLLRGREFGKLLGFYKDRVVACWGEIAVRRLESEHAALRHASLNEPDLKKSFAVLTDSCAFEPAWRLVKDRFPTLEAFSGALATLFPNTSAVESDFSILGWEKDEYRQSMTDLSLEGVMQAKQYDEIKKLIS
jgi:hypothetical protein